MALHQLYQMQTGIDVRGFGAISELVARASGRPVAPNKSIVGEAVFTHEAGIHVDGLLKNVLNYQGVNPKDLGREHRLVLGKHSGTHAVIQRFRDLGIELNEIAAAQLLKRIRLHASQTKRAPSTAELMSFYRETVASGPIPNLPEPPELPIIRNQPSERHSQS